MKIATPKQAKEPKPKITVAYLEQLYEQFKNHPDTIQIESSYYKLKEDLNQNKNTSKEVFIEPTLQTSVTPLLEEREARPAALGLAGLSSLPSRFFLWFKRCFYPEHKYVLLPCELCNSEGQGQRGYSPYLLAVHCMRCGHAGPFRETEKEAIIAWNLGEP